MNIPKIQIKRGTNRLESQLGKGKSIVGIFYDIFFFVPVTVIISAVMIIILALGLPASVDLLVSAFGSGKVNHAETEGSFETFVFNDVRADSPYFDAAIWLKKQKLISGYADGTIRLEDGIGRAELIRLLVNAKKVSPKAITYKNCYDDVKTDWYAPYVCYAKEKKWINGDKAKFQPNELLTRAEAVKLLVNVFELELNTIKNPLTFKDINSDDWFYQEVIAAQSRSLLTENPVDQNFRPHDLMKRGDVLKMLYRILLN